MSGLEHFITFQPAYDHRDKGYGVHCVEMRWVVRGPEGAVQFLVYTDWHLPGVIGAGRPLGADVGYHAPTPIADHHEADDPTFQTCEIIGGPCWYDGSSLHAEKVFGLLVREGGDAVWAYLDHYYEGTFGEARL